MGRWGHLTVVGSQLQGATAVLSQTGDAALWLKLVG